mgnify:CR=1 FL=1
MTEQEDKQAVARKNRAGWDAMLAGGPLLRFTPFSKPDGAQVKKGETPPPLVRGGFKEGFIKLSAYGPAVSDEARQKADEAKAKKLLSGLEGIYIRSYEFKKSGEFTPYTATWNVTGQPAISLPLFHGEDGLAGHSDGDVVCHAIADAALEVSDALLDLGAGGDDRDRRHAHRGPRGVLHAQVLEVDAGVAGLSETLSGARRLRTARSGSSRTSRSART